MNEKTLKEIEKLFLKFDLEKEKLDEELRKMARKALQKKGEKPSPNPT